MENKSRSVEVNIDSEEKAALLQSIINDFYSMPNLDEKIKALDDQDTDTTQDASSKKKS